MASIDFVVAQIEREGCFVVASKQDGDAAPTQPPLHGAGSRVKCQGLTASPVAVPPGGVP